MNANDYKGQATLALGPITLTNRTIRCGKEDCSTCSSGPGHPGQWYARVPGSLTANKQRADIYLGQHWSADDLKSKVVVKLSDYAKHEVINVLDRAATEERLAAIANEQKRLQGEHGYNETSYRANLDDIAKTEARDIARAKYNATNSRAATVRQYTTTKKRITTRLAELATERKTLTAKVKGASAQPKAQQGKSAASKPDGRK